MKLKSEKGYTGIDIAIAVVVLFIFVSLIAFLSYGMNSSANEVELKSKATEIAIEEIENLKSQWNFEDIANLSIANGNSEYIKAQELTNQKGFYRTITVEDYADKTERKIPGLVKKVTVKIGYMFKGKEENIELSTIFSKEN